ncbi:MAG: DUF5337 family protein [Pseudoprimorskyibacter sp.]|nr:DUF5337 family protein [Pseudoprimorskyibacter sp.]
MRKDSAQAKERRRIAILIAGVGVFWIVLTAVGAEMNWSQRTRALFDLMALTGFGVAVWKLVVLLRAGRDKKE